jgi:branched-chain amino acid transport system substrate-binding protein
MPAALVKGLETMHDFDLGDYFVSYKPDAHVGSRFVEIDVLNREGNVIR